MTFFYYIYLFWIFLLTILSGFLNSLAILSIQIPVSHFSGNLSKMAILLEQGKALDFLSLLFFLLSYFLGCIFAGFFIHGKEFSLKKRYGIVLLLISVFLFVSYYYFLDNIFFFYCLPTILGLQNGLFISYRGVIVRTTHITGNLTDAGVYLGKLLRGEKQDLWKIFFYLTNIFCFFLGCFYGSLQFTKYGKDSFFFIALLYLFASFSYFLLRFFHKKGYTQ